MDHMTAKVSCFARAYHYKHNKPSIFEDDAAEELLGKDYAKIAQNMADGLGFFFPGFEGTREEGLRLIMDKQLSPSVLARSAYCERKLAGEKKSGCRQYVIFASGYDTFSLRNTDPALSVYELDLPEMLADKAKRIEKLTRKSEAIYIPCNLAKEGWKDQLVSSGYCRNLKSFASLLGISYYLSAREFEELLINIHAVMAEGSVLCFDYPSTVESNETKRNQELAFGAGEQMKARYSYPEMQSLLHKCGFEIVEHLEDQEMTQQYFAEYNQCNPMHQIQAPVGVAYITAARNV